MVPSRTNPSVISRIRTCFSCAGLSGVVLLEDHNQIGELGIASIPTYHSYAVLEGCPPPARQLPAGAQALLPHVFVHFVVDGQQPVLVGESAQPVRRYGGPNIGRERRGVIPPRVPLSQKMSVNPNVYPIRGVACDQALNRLAVGDRQNQKAAGCQRPIEIL